MNVQSVTLCKFFNFFLARVLTLTHVQLLKFHGIQQVFSGCCLLAPSQHYPATIGCLQIWNQKNQYWIGVLIGGLGISQQITSPDVPKWVLANGTVVSFGFRYYYRQIEHVSVLLHSCSTAWRETTNCPLQERNNLLLSRLVSAWWTVLGGQKTGLMRAGKTKLPSQIVPPITTFLDHLFYAAQTSQVSFSVAP